MKYKNFILEIYNKNNEIVYENNNNADNIIREILTNYPELENTILNKIKFWLEYY
jgi:hypothetical protein